VAGWVRSYDGFMSPVVVRRTAWRASLEGHNVLIRLLERELQQDVGISLGWYDVLVHLAEAPKGKLRMNELADSLVLSRSWLTRRIDGMERAAIVHRCPADDDFRGVCAALTPEGRTLFRRASKAHMRSVERHFSNQLTSREAQVIEAGFDRIATLARQALSAP